LPSPIPHDWTPSPCLDLVNSRWRDHLGSGRYYDRLPEPLFRRAFLKRWGYRVTNPDSAAGIARLAALRAVMRRVMDAYASGRSLSPGLRGALELEANRAPAILRLRMVDGADQLTLERTGDEWDVVSSEIAASAARLIAERTAVKECANPSCSWMFVDGSKARSRRWCNVSVCGSLVNVRRYRSRNG
jgi:predicted RNA-binding Zn ribbon-like protein